jgi:polyhydroxyalkanoate synthesis regulator phasin
MIGTTRLAGAIVAGILGVAVTGASALAAFQAPDPAVVAATVVGSSDTARSEKEAPRNKIKDVLDKLVAAGTITQVQEDAILKAFADAADREKRDQEEQKIARHLLGDLMKPAAEYLGLPKGQLEKGLRDGQTLCEIANTTKDKSCDGLVTSVVTAVTAQVDKAFAEGKLTKEQADKIKAALPAKVGEFVHHKFEHKPTAAHKDKRPELTKPGELKPNTAPTPKPTASPTT